MRSSDMWNIFVFFCYVAILCTNFERTNCDESRLSDDVEPISYNLEITPDFNTFRFSGRAVIYVRVKFSTNVVKLHCKNFKMKDAVSPRDQEPTLVSVDVTWVQKDDLCILTFTDPLKRNIDYKLTIEYEGDLNEDEKGLYRLSYTENGVKNWLVATNFYGTYAREAFPCFDQPRFRTPFTLSIARNNNQRAISNMPLMGSKACIGCADNMVLDVFETSPPIPTYLVAFAVFEYSSSSLSNDLIKVWTRPKILHKSQLVLKQSDKVLSQLKNFISVPYEAPKLDMITVKTRYSLNDNWGLYMLEEDYIIVDETKASQVQKIIATAATCHLFARHWFGGQVTPVAWDYSWLTEAFAGYMEFFITHLVEPEWKIDTIFNIEILQSALWEELAYPGALTRAVVSESQINQKYGSINYYKGASIIRMLEHIVSRSSLRSAIQKYLKNSKNSNKGLVKPDDLFQALQYQSDMDSFPMPPHITITEVMKSWTENIGYPVVNVVRNYSSNTIKIEQQTYKSRQATVSIPDQQWITPFSYTTKSKPSFSATAPSEWIIKDEVTNLSHKVENPDWIICNLQRTGYYRVNYDGQNWNSLIMQLKEDPQKIHVLNRAQLIDDSFTFAFDGGLSYSVPLKLGVYLEKETEMEPLLAAMVHFEMLYEKYEDSASKMFFCIYIAKILEKQIQLIGFGIKPSDSYIVKMAKPKLLLLVCKIGLQSCVQGALSEYDSNSKDLSNVQPDLKEVVYCTALRNAQDDQTIYKNLWTVYRASDISYDKITILKAIGCSQNENLLKDTLSKIFDQNDADVDKTHRNVIYDAILSSSRGVNAALKFIQEQILARISRCNTEYLTSLETLLAQLEPKVRSSDHFRWLKKIEQDFTKLDCKKYADFISTVQHIRTAGIKRAKENNQMSDILRPIFYQVLNISPPAIPAKQSSDSFARIPSLFSSIACLCVAIIFNHL